MFERLKRTLVESFVGAIALGWLLAQGIVHFAGVFAAPVTAWVVRAEYGGITNRTAASEGLWLRDGLPELVRFLVLLLVWYILLRWLYFTPLKNETAEQTPGPEEGT